MTPYYDHAGITIYHGDCLEILFSVIGSCDAVITDPPYGISHKSNGQWFVGANPIYGDESTDSAEWCRRVSFPLPIAMFFSPYSPLVGWRNVLVWSKGLHVGIGGDREKCWKRDFELIGVENNADLEGGRDSSILSFNALSPPPSGHFAEKPVQLLQYLIIKLGAKSVLDPFMGSGTTLVAAKNLGRRAIGIEIEERYCEIAAKRLAQEVLPL